MSSSKRSASDADDSPAKKHHLRQISLFVGQLPADSSGDQALYDPGLYFGGIIVRVPHGPYKRDNGNDRVLRDFTALSGYMEALAKDENPVDWCVSVTKRSDEAMTYFVEPLDASLSLDAKAASLAEMVRIDRFIPSLSSLAIRKLLSQPTLSLPQLLMRVAGEHSFGRAMAEVLCPFETNNARLDNPQLYEWCTRKCGHTMLEKSYDMHGFLALFRVLPWRTYADYMVPDIPEEERDAKLAKGHTEATRQLECLAELHDDD